MDSKITEARKALEDAELRMQSAADAIELADEGADVAALEGEFDASVQHVEARKASVDRYEKVAEARKASPALVSQASVGKEEATYRPDSPDQRSFFRDLVWRKDDTEANLRMQRHEAEHRVYTDTTTGTSGGGFIPPAYLADLYVQVARAGRPFADILPSYPLPDTGMVVTIPKEDTGVTVAAQTEGSAVSTTVVTSSQLSVYVRTIAGGQDVTLQLLERSNPAFDQLIFSDLALAHATELDRQLIRGAAASKEHVGLHNVASVNTSTYTDASPTAAELLPKIYDCVQLIMSNRYLPPTHIVMHPRRAAFLAAGLSSTFPLFQQGGLFQAAGTQDGGMAGVICGLPVVLDANIGTTYGASTTQDEIFVVRAPDMPLMEGPIRTRVMEQVLSGDLAVRLQLFNYSAFASERYAKAIAIISGTGLVTPTF